MEFINGQIYYLLLVSVILHIIEEFVYPGGFAVEFRNLLSSFNLTISNFKIVIVNILFLCLVIFTLIEQQNTPLISLATFYLVGLNGILHVMTSLRLRRYFPGLITGGILYIPLAVLVFVYSNFELSFKIYGLLIAVLLHTVPFILMLTGKILRK